MSIVWAHSTDHTYGLLNARRQPKLQSMRAGILAVGSELLGLDRVDSNSLLLTEVLQSYGCEVIRKAVVRDVEGEIASEIVRLVAEFDLVLVTGGLGPTSDDLTREGTARALGRALIRDGDLLHEIEAKILRWSPTVPASNARQADVVVGASVLRNPRGTAPGMRIDHENATLFLFPGVPTELEGLIRSDLEPWLERRSQGRQIETRILRVACMSESALEDLLAPAYLEFDSDEISVLSSPGDIQIRLTVSGTEGERHQRLDAMTNRLGNIVGQAFYAIGSGQTLEGTVADLMTASGETVVTAESCTAGLVAQRLTRTAGSSDFFRGGVVAYSNELKEKLLGVSRESLAANGAVSSEVVTEMAEGAVERLGGDFGIAISGVAGPGGGTEDKPVGSVHLALARRADATWHRGLHLPGNRDRVRWLASQWALDLLRRRLLSAQSAT